MHKTFISYHHANDQDYKEELVRLGRRYRIFIDQSVDTGDISENLKDEVIREKIRDEYLRDSTITIVLIGLETKGRKHVDWESYSSMINGKVNKQSGLLVVNLPLTNSHFVTAPMMANMLFILSFLIGTALTIGQNTSVAILTSPNESSTTC